MADSNDLLSWGRREATNNYVIADHHMTWGYAGSHVTPGYTVLLVNIYSKSTDEKISFEIYSNLISARQFVNHFDGWWRHRTIARWRHLLSSLTTSYSMMTSSYWPMMTSSWPRNWTSGRRAFRERRSQWVVDDDVRQVVGYYHRTCWLSNDIYPI